MEPQSIKYLNLSGLFRKTNFSNSNVIIRIVAPILLGSISNILVNFILNPNSPQFLLDEFITGCILAMPITELNRYIDRRLERKISWIKYPKKRFIAHLILILLCLLVSLNVLGNAYMLITQKGFFSWKEIGIINLVAISLTLFLTFFTWFVHFYTQWLGAEKTALQSAFLVKELNQKITQTTQFIHLQKGNSKIKVEIKNIRIAKIEFGIIHVYAESGEYGFFQGTISQLYALLPTHLFFQVTRDAIVHRIAIKSVTSSTFGKIDLSMNEINGNSSAFTVSRPKAAAFRKWYSSISA